MSDIRVITLSGELDIARRDEARFALRVHGDEDGVLLDFSEATYADSTILSVLLSFVRDAGARAIPVAILIGTPQFARIVQYAGIADALPIFEDRASALAHLSETRR